MDFVFIFINRKIIQKRREILKQIFKRFRVIDYFIVAFIFSLILTQTYFEMELISKVAELITAIQNMSGSDTLWNMYSDLMRYI